MRGIKKNDLIVLKQLRDNARQRISDISQKTGMPKSTVFKRLKRLEEEGVVKDYICSLDYGALGFGIRVFLFASSEDKDDLKNFLLTERHVNSVTRIWGEYDFIAEVIFEDMRSVDEFMEELAGFDDLLKSNIFYLVEEVKKEMFVPGQ